MNGMKPAGAAALPGDRLSHAQHLIWAGQQLNPGVPLYNMAFTFTIAGELDIAAFTAAFQRVVDASDALRTVFRGEDGHPERVVLPSLAYEPSVREFDGRDAAQAWLEERARVDFDLARPLFESALLRTGAEEHIWYFNQHHLIADAWSMALLYRHVAEAYRSLSAGRQPEIVIPSYQSLVDAERRGAGTAGAERSRDYWEERLAASDAAPSLYGGPRRHPSTATTRLSVSLDRERCRSLRDLAARPDLRGLTPDMSLFNLFATVLTAWMWRASGQERLSLGCLAHNRATPQLKATNGVFIELFPLLVEIGAGETFTSLNDRVRAESMRLLQHARSGASLPEFGRTFNVVLNFITATLGDFDGRPVVTDWLHCGHGDPGHHLRVQVHDLDGTGELVVYFDFNEAVFDRRQREFAVAHFLGLLDGLVADPAAPIAGAAVIGEAERRLLGELSPVLKPAPDGTAPARFADQARLHGDRVAVAADGVEVGYAELDAWSNRLAHRLRRLGAGPDTVVGLCTERSVDMVAGILGIQKAGAAYLPLDPADPPDRRRLMLATSGALAVVGHGATAGTLAGSGLPMVRVDDEHDLAAEPGDAPETGLRPEHLAYVLFTSGSTGDPKAVMIEHRNLLALVDGLHERVYRNHAPPGAALRVALVAPYVFDPSVQQIFGALLQGHSLHVVPAADRIDGSRLHDFLARHRIDVTDGTPAHLRMLVDGSDRSLADLPVQHFIIGGEALPKALARRFLAEFAGRPPVLTNAYGPAECCVDCIAWQVTEANLDDYPTVPIGTPLPGETAHILGEDGRPQPFGVVGELCLGGSGVGRGYLDDPALTAARFVDDPQAPGGKLYRSGDLARRLPDGVIEFAGRKDTQVKVRGHRIELGEIEAALKQFRVERTLIPLATLQPPVEPARCRRCLLTDRHPGVGLDDEGVCTICRNYDDVRPAISSYFRPVDEFAGLVAAAREATDSAYDCLLLYSGGKDSSYVLYRLADMGLRVLAYTFDNGHISAAAFRNIERQTAKLGVDNVVSGTDRMDEIFLESLNDDSTVCSGCFRALTTISTRLAEDRGINVVVTGLSRGQIFDTKLAGLLAEGVRDTAEIEEQLRVFRRGYHSRRDRTARLLGVDLDDVDLERMYFVDFFRYDDTPTAGVHAFLRSRDAYWQHPEDTGFCSSNCRMNDVGIAVHSATEGYHNYEAPLSWDIRLGITTRDAALAEVGPVRNARYVGKVLDNIGFHTREVRDAAVVVHEDESGGRQLVAYYVASQPLTVPELRSFLSRSLPDYMIPGRFIQVEEIPLTPNGKIDRAALEPDARRPELGTTAAKPTNDVERALAPIWAAVLGLDQVGIHDSFFELGGDSINAIQIVSRARAAGLEVTASQLFETLTVAGLAAAVAAHVPAAGEGGTGAAPAGAFDLAGLAEDDMKRLAELLQ